MWVCQTRSPDKFVIFNPRRMREGYGSRSVYVCVCVCVTELAATKGL